MVTDRISSVNEAAPAGEAQRRAGPKKTEKDEASEGPTLFLGDNIMN